MLPRTPIIIIGLLLSAVAPPASADQIIFDPSLAAASAIAPDTNMTEDLKAGSWSVQPNGGYFTVSSAFDENGSTAAAHGFGGSSEVSYSLTSHFGVVFSGLGYSGSGDYTAGTGSLAGSNGTCSVNGWIFGTSLAFDPFSGDGFRWPFFVGLNYMHIASTTSSSNTVTSMTLNSPGYSFGFSPRFNIGFLRFEPFLITTTPTSSVNRTCAAGAVGGVCGPTAVQIIPVIGINIMYRPWNLSFFVNASSLLLNTGAQYYSFGPTFTWGGGNGK